MVFSLALVFLKLKIQIQRAKSIVLATTYYDDPTIVMEAQKLVDEKKSLLGLDTKSLELRMQERGPMI